MDGTVLVGLAGIAATLAATIVGWYYTGKAQTQPYRERLYSAQIEIIHEMLGQIRKVQQHANQSTMGTDTSIQDQLLTFNELFQTMAALSEKVSLFMPRQVFLVFHEYEQECLRYVEHMATGKDHGPVVDRLNSTRTNLFALCRAHLGVDSLNQATRGLLEGEWEKMAEEFNVDDNIPSSEAIRREYVARASSAISAGQSDREQPDNGR